MIESPPQYRDLKEAFFPVEEQPISWGENKASSIRIPGYKAIVDRETNRALSVVSSNYHLVTNEEAYYYAGYVVKTVFEGKTLDDFVCYNILMPKTKGSCRIDLIIPNHFNKMFGDTLDSWTPFVRISNSYNRSTTLKFEIGFCRWICLNGVIFGQKGISLSLNHIGNITLNEIDVLIKDAKEKIGSVASLWTLFEEKMKTLKSIALPSSSALAIYCKVFDVDVDKDKVTNAQREKLSMRAKQIVEASKQYFRELGNNAYAMMNVMTDFASFPEWTPNPSLYVDGYQRKVGNWVDDFIEKHKEPDFSLSGYIGEKYQNTAYYLESLVAETGN